MHLYQVIRKIVCVMVLATAGVHAAGRESIDWSNTEVVIRGDYYRAASVAYADFSNEQLARRAREAAAPDYNGDRKLVEYLSRIENFNIEVGFGNGRYHVRISPRLSAQVPGIFGGGAYYIIEPKEFKVVDRQYSK